MSVSDQFPDWKRKMKLLANSVWQDAHLNEAKIDQWLENFCGKCFGVKSEQQNAFHLLHQFLYYGKQEVYESLRVLFRDHFIYPTVQELRRMGNSPNTIESLLERRLIDNTRIVGVGHPSESGQGFLYDFRLANNLPTDVFASIGDIIYQSNFFAYSGNSGPLMHLIYFDDFCATGQQVKARVETDVQTLRANDKNLRISYYLLFATSEGINNVQRTNLFDNVEAAIVFDDDYKAFDAGSHYYRNSPLGVDISLGKQLSTHYGSLIFSAAPLGYKDCQLLVGFERNTPDNTLPIFWSSDTTVPWHPIFPRVQKK